MKTYLHQKTLALAFAGAVALASHLTAQTESIYVNPEGTNDNWTNSNNWDTAFFPDAPDAFARFGELTDTDTDRVNINFGSGLLNETGVLDVSGIAFLEDFNADTDLFLVRNSNINTSGALRIHGHNTTINGDPATLLIGNFGAPGTIRFSPTNASYVIELNNSGIIHNEGGLLRISTEITEAGGAQSITKTGSGILRFDRLDADRSSQHSTYSGGFTIEEGTVEWAFSGGSAASPFGIGPLTMRGGTLRSTTDSGRTITTDIVLDGGATLGSLEDGHTGNIAINSAGGSLNTNLTSDSTLTVHNQVTWHQPIAGDFSLTKDGVGTLIFSGTGGEVTHTGATTVTEGILRVNTEVTDSEVTVQAGATLGFGTAADPGEATFGQTLVMEADSLMAFRIDSLESHDSLAAFGAVVLGGGDVGLEIELGFNPELNDVFVLIENLSGTPIDGGFAFGGSSLGEGDQFLVSSGEFSQLFEVSYLHNGDDFALTAVPEPSTWALWAGLSMLVVVGWRRRRTRNGGKSES